MDSKLILIVIGVTATVVGCSEAISCYNCDSVTNSKCLDPFNSNGVGNCTGLTCMKTWGHASETAVIVRACLPTPVDSDGCVEATAAAGKGKACVCKTDFCNDGQKTKPTIYSVVIGVAITTVVSIASMNLV